MRSDVGMAASSHEACQVKTLLSSIVGLKNDVEAFDEELEFLTQDSKFKTNGFSHSEKTHVVEK